MTKKTRINWQSTVHSTDYKWPKPTYSEAIKDRVKEIFTSRAVDTQRKRQSKRQRMLDET